MANRILMYLGGCGCGCQRRERDRRRLKELAAELETAAGLDDLLTVSADRPICGDADEPVTLRFAICADWRIEHESHAVSEIVAALDETAEKLTAAARRLEGGV